MLGILDLHLGLALWGNAVLQGHPLDLRRDFFPHHELFSFTKRVEFVSCGSPFAADPNEWIEKLREDQVVRFGVAVLEDSSSWETLAKIKVLTPASLVHWSATWERADRSQWRVEYHEMEAAQDLIGPFQADPRRLLEAVRSSLRTMSRFAHEVGDLPLSEWMTAITNEVGRASETSFAPPGFLGQEHDQLLRAVRSAWVFGGMGTWDDMSLCGSNRTRHELLRKKHIGLILRSIACVADAGLSSAPPGCSPFR